MTAFPTTCLDVDGNAKENPSITAMVSTSDSQEERIKVDSCCRGAHVVRDAKVLASRLDTSNWSKLPSVEGIAPGHKLETTAVGKIAAIDGKAVVTPKAGANLLSLMEMIKYCDGSVIADKNDMIVRNGKGDTILHAQNVGDDFWSVSVRELSPEIRAFVGETDIPLISEQEVNVGRTRPTGTARGRSRGTTGC